MAIGFVNSKATVKISTARHITTNKYAVMVEINDEHICLKRTASGTEDDAIALAETIGDEWADPLLRAYRLGVNSALNKDGKTRLISLDIKEVFTAVAIAATIVTLIWMIIQQSS